jgi:hypothetical protein
VHVHAWVGVAGVHDVHDPDEVTAAKGYA